MNIILASLLLLTPPDTLCLAENMYHEARGEGIVGMLAVSEVVMNRVADNRWPSDICGVVHDPYQFSWTIGNVKSIPPNLLPYYIRLAEGFRSLGLVKGAQFYYAHDQVTPIWASSMKVVAIIGNHTFLEYER
jgi:spore germination cell wall hydrolase CwlJ-like protein